MTYHKRYALVGYLSIESEVDTDASSLSHIQENSKEKVSSINVSLINSLKETKIVNIETVTKSTIKQQSVSHKSVTKFESLSKRIPAK
ncbi:ERF family protein [Borrelia turicatae]|uniref:ERF family protein n=1 Tax=Borrelia turicatae TaxID=142 RepID=UPI0039BD6C69